MRVIRGRRGGAISTSRRLAALLALFSLLLQIWVTAGHFHPEDFNTLYSVAGVSGPLAASRDDGGTSPSSTLTHNDCALCFSVQLAGSAALASAAPLLAPALLQRIERDLIRDLPRIPRPHLLFQTRAPPVA